MMLLDQERVRTRVGNARALGEGGSGVLLAYDANAIQRFVTASSRPVAMRGASATVDDFDRSVQERDGCVLAGGGRGMVMVASPDDAERLGGTLRAAFAEMTFGGSLATAWVPFDAAKEHACLTWLQQRLVIAKDEAPAPASPGSGDALCEDCHQDRGRLKSQRKGSTGKVCPRCARMAEVGRDRKPGEEARTLADLSRLTPRRIVAVSADGNDMGRLFAALDSLEAVAITSEAVRAVFAGALDDGIAACRRGNPPVALVSGGDDIRAFLGPEDLLAFVEAFVRGLERRAREAGTLGGLLPGDGLASLGVGVGAALAGETHPAFHLIEAAHAMERAAKRLCYDGGARSAFSLVNLAAGDVLREDGADHSALDLGEKPWTAAYERAAALASVPASQRQQLLDLRDRLDPAEFANAYRYQVARSRPWQAYVRAAGGDWRSAEDVVRYAPSRLDEELARLISSERSGGRSSGDGEDAA